MASHDRGPGNVIPDIDNTCDVAYGHSNSHCRNAHYDERERRAVARVEATTLGFETGLEYGSPESIRDSLYCARGQAENLFKLRATNLLELVGSIGAAPIGDFNRPDNQWPLTTKVVTGRSSA